MQTLARVNRTFKGKQDGLLIAYAPLADNLDKALSEYTVSDQENKPIGRDVDEAVGIASELVAQIREMLTDCDWRSIAAQGGSRAWRTAATTATNYLRDAANPLNSVEPGAERLSVRYRTATGRLARAWALASGRAGLAELHDEIAFYEEVRVWMAKFDAAERQSRDEPIPEEISRLLGSLVADSIAPGDVLDIYDAAGLPRLALDDLGPEFLAKAQAAPNAHLAIEALRKSLTDAGSAATRGNVVRQRAFSERIAEIMNRYTNMQLTSAEVIAALVELAKEVAAEASRGSHFSPPLSSDELSFYDAVATNESAIEVQGEDVLAQIARELVTVMRRDVRTDWTVRDDVRAKLRSSIKRLLVKFKYPPDKQPDAIKLVMDQMESMAPRYAAERER
jgi:type I restriction enzyme R subunit